MADLLSCTIDSPPRSRPGIDLGQWLAGCLLALAVSLPVLAAEPVIRVDGDAGLPPAELESILKDFRAWAVRVYRYHHLEHPAPVGLRLTRKAPFGFYEGDTVILPPSKDRWAMLDDWVHELAHHATGHESSFFFKEGIAVNTLETLFREDGRVPSGWPQFGQSTDAWVVLYRARGLLPRLMDAMTWEGWQGDTADKDFRSWQIYNIGGSFLGWYIGRYGYDAFRQAFKDEWPAQDTSRLQEEWLAALQQKHVPEFDPDQALSENSRYREYLRRLRH